MNATVRNTTLAAATQDDPRWQAVCARDRNADGRFWYSVRTTGVYCKPSCAARLPRPEHVRFHASTQDAEHAGFRACKRCHPDRAAIRHAVGSCSLGTVLVAESSRGVRAILLGDAADAVKQELRARFSDADIVHDDAAVAAPLARVIEFLQTPTTGLDLLLDVQGTAFQQRVWQALREIPAGSTASYRDIAERIGSPNSVRAVAGACAANALAVAIPCHRVVKHDGALSGYRWGVARKRALLEREARG